MIIIGIDPGITGAIAIYRPAVRHIEVHDMPRLGKSDLDRRALLDILAPEDEPAVVWLEQVTSYGQGSASAMTFGRVVGQIEMAITAQGHELRRVTPAKWKRALGLPGKVKAKDAAALARGRAQERFPHLASRLTRVCDHGRAEAALIALYGSENTRGTGGTA